MKKVFKIAAIAWHTIAGILASAELLSGHLSTLLGPELGPKVAAAALLANVILVAVEAAIKRVEEGNGQG